MGTVSKKTQAEAYLSKSYATFLRDTKEKERENFLAENVGKEINMSDRDYVITPDGSYKRVKSKQEIRYSSKRKGELDATI